MGTKYLIFSSGLLLVEAILQLCVTATYSTESDAVFVILLTLVIGPLVVINLTSAIQVTRTQDFSGKGCGRILCIALHSFQFGIFWRTFKLFISFEKNEWKDYLSMRLFHCAFQSLPFCIILSYTMFKNNDEGALNIITVIISMISASVAFTLYQTGEKLCDTEGMDKKVIRVRRTVGIVILTLSTALVLLSRCSSIVLFTVVQSYWIVLPLSIHVVILSLVRLCRFHCNEENIVIRVVKVIYKSFVNVYDMTGQNYAGVKCSYVLFYTAVLLENLVLSSYWMLTSDSNERFRLLTTLVIIISFIVGIILKFASCGCIFNVESDILSDAFNNPELQQKTELCNIHAKDINSEEIVRDVSMKQNSVRKPARNRAHINSSLSTSTLSSGKSKKQSSKQNSLRKTALEYDNKAFIKSQGNLMPSVAVTSASGVQYAHSGSHSGSHSRSRDSHQRSRDSQSRSHDSHKRSQSSNKRSGGSSNKNSNQSSKGKTRRRPKSDNHEIPFTDSNFSTDFDDPSEISSVDDSRRARNRQRLKVSDRSIHGHHLLPNFQMDKAQMPDHLSARSRNSRNTNTLNGSVQNYAYNGFDDPYRERRLLEIAKQKQTRSRHQRRKKSSRHKQFRSIYSPAAFSLDSSELYPSISSDTSSMSSSYFVPPRQMQSSHRKHNSRHQKVGRQAQRDRYSPDFSNSEYLSSLNDFSMTDSCSCSGSSSDEAITWPPSQTFSLLDKYNIPDKVSSKDNVMHWLDAMESSFSDADMSFSTLREPSIGSETDISLSAMQTFEVKKERTRFKKLLPKPKEVILKFRSLNYKGKEKELNDRPYPLNREDKNSAEHSERSKPVHVISEGKSRQPAESVPIPNIQESIV